MKILDTVFVYHLVERDRIAWHGRYHEHHKGEYEVHLFLEGGGTFLVGKARYPIKSGLIFLTGPHEFHSIIPGLQDKPVSYYAVLFQPEADDDCIKNILEPLNKTLPGNKNGETDLRKQSLHTCRIYFDDIVRLHAQDGDAAKKGAVYLLQSILMQFFVGKQENTLKGITKQKNKSVYVEWGLSYMQKNVRNSLSIAEMACLLGVSQEHFIRTFREEVGMSPYQYLTRLKIEGASGLLISTPKSIGEIAEWFGFENQFHFSRVFKNCTGLSPAHYRQTYLQIVDFAQAQDME